MIDVRKQNELEISKKYIQGYCVVDADDNIVVHRIVEPLEIIQFQLLECKGWLFSMAECCELLDDCFKSVSQDNICSVAQQTIIKIEKSEHFKGWDYYKNKFTNDRN